jgi:hypothetical protein
MPVGLPGVLLTKATFDLKWAEKAGRTDFRECFFRLIYEGNAGIAQLVEQLICNQQVVGSNPTVGWLLCRFVWRMRRGETAITGSARRAGAGQDVY